jgi:hypothetical protein
MWHKKVSQNAQQDRFVLILNNLECLAVDAVWCEPCSGRHACEQGKHQEIFVFRLAFSSKIQQIRLPRGQGAGSEQAITGNYQGIRLSGINPTSTIGQQNSCVQKSFVEDALAIHLAMRVGFVVF